MEAKFHKEGKVRPYTPAGAILGGAVIQLVSGLAAVAVNGIAAGIEDDIRVDGIFDIQAAAVIGNKGDNAWWDDNGDPYGGTAGTGAVTTSAVDGDYWIGTLTQALTATAGRAYVALNEANPTQPAWPNRIHELKSDNYSVDIEDAGKVIHIDTDAKEITLLGTVAGFEVIIVNDAADGGLLLTIDPAAADKIMGPDIAGTDNKDQDLTKVTSIRGDFMHLVATPDGWLIRASRGIWVEES